MSVVIVGGNECMVRQYKDLCSRYNCSAKVYARMSSGLRDIGSPDLVVLFMNTVSHKMVHCTLNNLKSDRVRIARAQSSSISALRRILDAHAT